LDVNTDLVLRILVNFLREEIRKAGFGRAVVGLSGGADSSLSTLLAARALGPPNVTAVLMPYRASSPDSVADADEVVRLAGVRRELVDITPMVDPYFAGFPDADYRAIGAAVAGSGASCLDKADVVLRVNAPESGDGRRDEIELLTSGCTLVSVLFPTLLPERMQKLAEQRVRAYAIDAIPRISRAQAMDALSSQANISGYKSVLMAADRLPKILPMMMTAAGTISPAKVLIVGAGVAGLQAIATAHRLGAIVHGFDVRSVAK
jgi:hypothetical protein